jgi:hypothetical protein
MHDRVSRTDIVVDTGDHAVKVGSVCVAVSVGGVSVGVTVLDVEGGVRRV